MAAHLGGVNFLVPSLLPGPQRHPTSISVHHHGAALPSSCIHRAGIDRLATGASRDLKEYLPRSMHLYVILMI